MTSQSIEIIAGSLNIQVEVGEDIEITTGGQELNLQIEDNNIEITTGQSFNIQINDITSNIEVVTIGPTIDVQVGSITTANFINADGKFYFDGPEGDVYFKYNLTSELFELWVNGTKEKEWGTVTGGSPFA